MKTARVTGPLALPCFSYFITAALQDLAARDQAGLAKKKLTWKGLYAGRRGAGTILVDLTGSLVAAQEPCGTSHYKMQTENALPNGMRLLEAATTQKR